MATALVSIIIPNFNGSAHLRYCLPTLTKIDYPRYEIIVVDNGSTDDSLAFLRQNYPRLRLVELAANRGFVGGCNAGLKEARGEYILFLNNDTKVEPDFLTKLVKVLTSDPHIAATQPQIRQMENPQMLDCIGGFLTGTGFLYHYGINKPAAEPRYQKARDLFSCKGVAILIRRAALDRVGSFDEDFFAYFEETDLCQRLWLAGFRVRYVPESRIYHERGGTARKMDFSFIQYYSFRNRINTHLKNLSALYLWKIMPVHLGICFLLALIQPRFFTAIYRAIGWNIANIGPTMRKRRHIQRQLRQVKDRDYLKKLRMKVRLSYYYYFLTGIEKYRD